MTLKSSYSDKITDFSQVVGKKEDKVMTTNVVFANALSRMDNYSSHTLDEDKNVDET